MRAAVVVLALLCGAATAAGSTALDVIRLPKPAFPAPTNEASRDGPRLVLVSSRYHEPASFRFDLKPALPRWAPRSVRGLALQDSLAQRRTMRFLLYGRDGSSARYLLGGTYARGPRYAFDFVNFGRPPGGGSFEQVTWAREANGVLYVENTHLTYARATRRRNAYISAIDLGTRKTLWRSPALVVNARTFVLAGDLIVSGYGFTAEPDYLYLLDRRTGRVLHRLAVPSAPEVITLRNGRLHVRTYDRRLVVRIARS